MGWSRQLLFLSVLLPVHALGQTDPQFTGPFHVVAKPFLSVRSVVSHTHVAPNMRVSVWGCLVAIPVSTEGQDNAKVTIDLPKDSDATWEKVTEDEGLRRTIASVHIPVHSDADSHQVHLQATFSAILNKRTLVAGPPETMVKELSQRVREAYLAKNSLYDFDNPDVVAWMAADSLTRTKAENDMQFAYRAFKSLTRRVKSEQRSGIDSAAQVCNRGVAAGGGLGVLFGSVLRANGIPARTLWGKTIRPTASGKDRPTAIEVRSEFYAKGIGWVPVNLAKSCGQEDPSPWFGNDDGTLLLLHYEPFFYKGEYFALQTFQCGYGEQVGSWKDLSLSETQLDTVEVIGDK